MLADTQEISDNWRARGFSCELWVDPPGQVWEGFVHLDDELLLVLDGRLEIEMNGRCRVAEPGVEIRIPKGVTHSVRNIAGATTRWLYGYRVA